MNATSQLDSIVRRGKVMAACLAGLMMFDLGEARAAVLWTFEWDATTETPASVGFTLTGTNPNTAGPNGLIIPASAYYSATSLFDGESDPGWTLAFRVRRLDSGANFGSFLSVYDGTSNVDFGFFSDNLYRLNTSSGLVYPTAPGSDNQTFADVQITMAGSAMNIYFNGNDTPAYTYTAAANTSTPGRILLGDFSANDPVSEVTYLKWTDEGAFLPSQMIPEPTALALVLGGLVVFACRRRMRSER